MKCIIAGIRYLDPENRVVFDNLAAVELAVYRSGFQITEVISGGALGVDQLGERWAETCNIPITKMYINQEGWSQLGKRAGPLRNRRMAEYADCAVILWDGKSRGTKNMIAEMQRLSKPYYLYMVIPNVEELCYD